MKKFFRWIVSVAGYGAYTLVVFLFLLWFLFPNESFRVWLQNQLANKYPSLTWKVKEVRLAWPFSMMALDVQAGDQEEGSKPLLHVEEIKVRPDLKKIFAEPKNIPFIYTLRSLDGSVTGSISLVKERGEVSFSGQIRNMQLGGLDEIWKRFGRSVTGKASGPFNYKGNLNDFLAGQLQADLSLENGSIELLQPILGLEKLDFNQVTSSLSSNNRVVTVAGGKMDSDLFAVEFGGTVTLADNLFGSGLDLDGSFEPRPELLANLNNATVVNLIKDQLRDNKLSFQLTDTLLEPGIVFQGASGVIEGIIRGSVR